MQCTIGRVWNTLMHSNYLSDANWLIRRKMIQLTPIIQIIYLRIFQSHTSRKIVHFLCNYALLLKMALQMDVYKQKKNEKKNISQTKIIIIILLYTVSFLFGCHHFTKLFSNRNLLWISTFSSNVNNVPLQSVAICVCLF